MGHVARSAGFKLTFLWSQPSEGTEQRPPRTGCFARLQACNGQNPNGSPLSPREAGKIACHTRSQAVSILDCVQTGPIAIRASQLEFFGRCHSEDELYHYRTEPCVDAPHQVSRARKVGWGFVGRLHGSSKMVNQTKCGLICWKIRDDVLPPLARLRQLSQRLLVSRASWVSTPA